MLSLSCAILEFIIFAILGWLTLKDANRDKIPVYVTPWNATQSWLVYGALMLSLFCNIVAALRLMNGG